MKPQSLVFLNRDFGFPWRSLRLGEKSIGCGVTLEEEVAFARDDAVVVGLDGGVELGELRLDGRQLRTRRLEHLVGFALLPPGLLHGNLGCRRLVPAPA